MAMQRARTAGAVAEADMLRSGDVPVFERLYDEYSTVVYGTALRILGNATQAQDVVQDVFLRLWRQPERFDVCRGSLGNYLRLLARSRALDLWREAEVAGRARERMKAIALRDEPRLDDRPVALAEFRRERSIVLAALMRLPAAQRDAIVMAYWGGLTADQIASRCGQPVGTVKSRIRLGLMKLRERCEVQLVEPELPSGLPLAAQRFCGGAARRPAAPGGARAGRSPGNADPPSPHRRIRQRHGVARDQPS